MTSIKQEILTKRFGRYASVNALSLLVSQVLSFILIKVLTTSLTQESYGTLAVFVSLGALIGSLSASFFTSGIWRYAEQYRSEGRGEKASAILRIALYATILLNCVIVMLLGFGAIVLGSGLFQLPGQMSYAMMGFVAAFAMASSLNALLVSLAHGDQNASLALGVALALGLAQLASVATTLTMGFDSLNVFGGMSLSSLVAMLLLIAMVFRKSVATSVDSHDALKVIRFAAPLALRGFFTSSISTALLLIASIYSGFTLSAVVSVGLTVLALLEGVLQNLFSSYRQYAIASYENSRLDETGEFDTTKASLFVLEVIILGAFWVYILAPELITLVSTQEYIVAVEFVRIAVLGKAAIWVGYLYGSIGHYLAEKTYFETISAFLGLAAALVVGYWLVPSNGLYGLAVAFLISSLVISICNL